MPHVDRHQAAVSFRRDPTATRNTLVLSPMHICLGVALPISPLLFQTCPPNNFATQYAP
jgi:hypothetical protein